MNTREKNPTGEDRGIVDRQHVANLWRRREDIREIKPLTGKVYQLMGE